SPMGMDLVPVCETDELEAVGGISIDSRVRQNMGIRTDVAVLAPLRKSIATLGHVAYDERRVTVITTKLDGWVREMYVDFTGETVKKGDPLFTIDAPQLVSTQQELVSARRAFERTGSQADRGILEAARQRLRYWDISSKQIEGIESSGEVAQTLTIESPADGVVVHKNALEGKYVRSDTELFRIADLSQVWVFAHFYEMDAPFVAVGASARVRVPYDGGPPIEGTIDYVFPWLDAKTREVKARIVLSNAEGRLKPEMFVDVDLRADLGEDGLLVDDSAVIRTGVRNVVFVQTEPGSYTPRVVKLGRQLDERVEITAGIRAGEKVVIKGQFMLDSESRLKEAIGKYEMDSAPHEHGGAVGMLEQRLEEGCSYTCPMPEHFHVCGQEPGPCPECGMAMQPIPTLLEQHRAQVEAAPPPPVAAPPPTEAAPPTPDGGAVHEHGGQP
ncbi:MAG: efflux RND transporter periplasmic adaptor subunit, partial [Deltaproteobacteria bacterium]|nr:efflux RND transporter periplasmic adaptor subunit [Deltaproteobacteria bacterium]MCB9789247.1 efflux RND transporter periplasmic adaptor subunit [Deltaproteobacteria bacterium]